MGIQINGQTGRITRPDGNVKIPNSEIGISQLTVENGASVTGIMTVTAGVGKTITLDPSQKMLTLGDTTMHQDSSTGDTILMRNGVYNPFRASRFLIDDVTVIDANRNFIGATGTFTGNVSVGGVLTYEDVTNVDSVGLITARSGINVTGGSVGIGTDNPDSKLHIEGTGETNLTLEGSAASVGCYLLLKNKNTSANSSTAIQGLDGSGQGISEVKFISSDDSNNEGFITLSTRPASGSLTERLRIASDGAINIGTGAESSTSSNLLEMYVGPTDDSYATIRGKYNRSNEFNRSEVRFGVESNAGGKGFLAFATGTNSASEKVRITSAGNFGIGTDDPSTKLHVDGDLTISNGTEQNAIRTDSDGKLQFLRNAAVNNAAAMTIDDATGNVGIGTENPGVRLHIRNPGFTGLDIQSERSSGTIGGIRWLNSAGDNRANIYGLVDEQILFATGGDERVRIGSGGAFAIGTAAINANFAVGGAPGGGTGHLNVYTSNSGGWAAQMRNDHANGNGLFIRGGGDAAGEYPLYVTNNDENNAILIVTGDQKVGILQTSPNNVLDIGGVGADGLSVRMGGSGYSTLFRYGSNEDNYISQGPSGQTIFRDRENDEHVRIDSAGRMGLNCPGQDLSAFNANGSQDLVIFSRGSSGLSAHAGITLHGGSTTASQCSLTFADGNAGAQRYAGSIDYLHSVDALSFRVATTGAMRIDSAHRLMMGTNTSVHTYRKIQVVGSYSGTAQRQGALLRYGEASSNGPVLTFEKNRSNSGGTSSVAADDAIGEIHFQGTDQAGSYRLSSMIRGEAATTPANNRVPGQIKFYCDDGSSLNETVRITRYGRTQVSKEFAIRNSAGYGNGRNSRVEYIQGGSGTYSTCTVTIDQNSFGSTVYDIQVHGYSSSTAHVAGGYYQNSSIYNDSKSINHATSGVSVTGPTAAGGQTATFVFSRTSGWVHPICSISISTGGDGFIDDSDITIVWS